METERRKDYPQILVKLEVIESSLAELKIDVKETKKILNGNGETGLCGKVNNLIGGVKVLWGVVVAVIIGVIYKWMKI